MSQSKTARLSHLGPAVEAPERFVEPVARWMALCRGLWFDLPLTWTMEMSRFASKELQEQVDHWIRLTGCANFQTLLEEQRRFVRRSVAELGEEVEELAREARIAVAA